MKTIAIIPARGSSKRLPGKNAYPFCGMPLLAHSILYAKANAGIIDDVYVTTDDATVKLIALKYGAKVIDRPAGISGDLEPTVSALKHTLEHLDDSIAHVVLLQPTNPLRPQNLLEDAISVYQSNHYDSLFTVSRNHQKLGKIKHGQFEPFNYKPGERSQDLEPLYFENGLLYLTKVELILQNTIMSDKAFPFETNHVFSNVDIDTREDLDYAEYLYKKYNP